MAPDPLERCGRVAAAFRVSFGASAAVETPLLSSQAAGLFLAANDPESGYSFETIRNVYRSMHSVKVPGKLLYAVVHPLAYHLGMARL